MISVSDRLKNFNIQLKLLRLSWWKQNQTPINSLFLVSFGICLFTSLSMKQNVWVAKAKHLNICSTIKKTTIFIFINQIKIWQTMCLLG